METLKGIKVIEMAGLAPSPFCGMMLSDFGADVVVVDRVSKGLRRVMTKNPLTRGKRSIRINLKTKAGIKLIIRMIEGTDVLLEAHRPGVMEKFGLGPEDALKWNPRLIYARLTGWGQNGTYANMAGHDINYISISGILSLLRRKGERPLPPLNLLGDFAGGGMLCAFGILLALIERSKSGMGQVIDAAMLDGITYLSTFFHGLFENQQMSFDIGTNRLDGGAPYYQIYETSDGKYMAVGSIERQFYTLLLTRLGLDPDLASKQDDKDSWQHMKELIGNAFKKRTRDEWARLFERTDACVTPVLDMDEIRHNQHNQERRALANLDGIVQPIPEPRLSRTPGKIGQLIYEPGAHTRNILQELGLSEKEIEQLFASEAVG